MREVEASKKLFKSDERYSEHKKPLTPFSVGDSGSVQNRVGSKPLRWDRTGLVAERLENKQTPEIRRSSRPRQERKNKDFYTIRKGEMCNRKC